MPKVSALSFLMLVGATLLACGNEPVGSLEQEEQEEQEGNAEHHDDEAEEAESEPESPVDAGTPVEPPQDAGAMDAGPTCAVTAVPKAAYLKAGLHPRASDALQHLKVTAARVTQTIGSAPASAGTHGRDGTVEGHDYSAATDLSVKGMTNAQVAVFLEELTSVGFMAYYREPGKDGWPSTEIRHIHAIWPAAKMKASLQRQVEDWRVNKNALASHTRYNFKTWTPCWHDTLYASFKANNP